MSIKEQPSKYIFSDLQVGTTEEFTVTITSEMMKLFCQITGDINPLHTNEEYAKKSGYPSPVVYGMLTSSFYSTLAGVYLPGERSLIQSVESKLLAPVFVGDTLTVRGVVSEIHDVFQMIVVKTTIINQSNRKVAKGVLQIGIREDKDQD